MLSEGDAKSVRWRTPHPIGNLWCLQKQQCSDCMAWPCMLQKINSVMYQDWMLQRGCLHSHIQVFSSASFISHALQASALCICVTLQTCTFRANCTNVAVEDTSPMQLHRARFIGQEGSNRVLGGLYLTQVNIAVAMLPVHSRRCRRCLDMLWPRCLCRVKEQKVP